MDIHYFESMLFELELIRNGISRDSPGAMKSSSKSGQRSNKQQQPSSKSRRNKNNNNSDGIDGKEEDEESEAVAMDSEAFTKGRFGSVPRCFGGCRLDFFSLDKDDDDRNKNDDDDDNDSHREGWGKESSGRDEKPRDTHDMQVLLPLKTLQRGYLPAAFDSTDEEWTEVKDYLWLLGQVYTRKAATDELDRGDESQEEYKADGEVTSVKLLQSPSQDDSSAESIQRDNLEREMTHLYNLV
jgi:hypothetical protein